MIIIGERLNSTRKPVFKALQDRNADFIVREAVAQEKAGAHFIDFNPAAMLEDELVALDWVIPLLQKNISLPLSIDTPNPKGVERGLQLHKGQALLNSITGETKKLGQFLPLVKEYEPKVIALCLDDTGMPQTAEQELAAAQKLVEQLDKAGVPKEDIFLDPLVQTIGADQNAGRLFLDALESLKKNLPDIKTIAGISNVSFGLPKRRLLNRTFLAMAISSGLDAAILDPLDPEMIRSIKAAEGLAGKDPMLMGFIAFSRNRSE